ncbi:MAG: hypothetical protein ACKOEC_09930 [Acidimicrobiia bacterium]
MDDRFKADASMVIRVVSGIGQRVGGKIVGGCIWKRRSYGFGLADFMGLGLNGNVVQFFRVFFVWVLP